MLPLDYHTWLRGCAGAETLYETRVVVAAFDAQGRPLLMGEADTPQLPSTLFELDDTFESAARRAVAAAGAPQATVRGLVGLYSHPRWGQGNVQPWALCLWAALDSDAPPLARLDADHLPPLHAAMLAAARRVRAGGEPYLEPAETVPPLRPYWSLLRGFVGPDPLILPGGSAVVADETGRILAVQRADLGCWQLPGGLADLGETTTAAIVREVWEETGLRIAPDAIVGVYSAPATMTITVSNGDVIRGVDLILACHVTGGRLNPAGNDAENTCAAFVPLETLLSAGCWDSTALQVCDYLNRDGWPVVR